MLTGAMCSEWKMSENIVNHSQVGNVFMLGPGGIFVVIFSAYFGRYPVLFWFTVVGLATAIWCTAAVTFESFMAARILNGFFSIAAEAVSCIRVILHLERRHIDQPTGWAHVDQGHVLLSRTSSKDQSLGIFHHSFALLRPAVHSLYHQHPKMAVGFCPLHLHDRFLSGCHHIFCRRNVLRPKNTTEPATCSAVTLGTAHWHRTMEDARAAELVLGSGLPPFPAICQSTSSSGPDILHSLLRLGRRHQHNPCHLPHSALSLRS